ncbi:AAA family ATPase [Tumebacillus flagellatus]|uniref:Endonuclease GajA/Old nuclease/RecF-like AAA domain-containing protein n=1 Tax=Tumebacillus flagellatus TaxID=1157490 RepID=A0A074LQI1_9BACL|nr:AAA family ATPase [Tumebacillus flagellatus]KEO82078.1 hypothetical protein EL26_17365 [Tumebacillus flagellatus]
MRQTWKLNVENFGKIGKASIEIAPLMIFTGENNSGKSYLMSLLWGIINSGTRVFQTTSSDAYRKCQNWLEAKLKQHNDTPFSFDDEGVQVFIAWFNEELDSYKEKLMKFVFGFDISIGKVFLSDYSCGSPFDIHITNHEESFGYSSGDEGGKFFVPNYAIFSSFDEEMRFELLRHLSTMLLFRDYFMFVKGTSYLPASRTGFLLSYPVLVNDAFSKTYGNFVENTNTVKFGGPTLQFLRELTNDDKNSVTPQYEEIAEFLQQNILKGQIIREQKLTPLPTYQYQPDNSHQSFPFYVTSSLVTELTPIVIFLKYKRLTSLIIEEPEAHLHLEMQKKMAIAIVRLVNEGLPVWITTHSDTMAQQLNNLIQLYNHPNRQELAKQFGYEPDDFLCPDKAVVYQFTATDAGTKVEKLPLTSGGFAFPTFTNSILEQANQTLAFEVDTDDDHE